MITDGLNPFNFLLFVALVLSGGAALTSHNRVLGPNEEKHICEVDCHHAYSVLGTKTTRTLDGRTAKGPTA